MFLYLKVERNVLKVNKMGDIRLFIKKLHTMALITEKFASRMLANLARQHGGIRTGRNGGMRDGTVSWYSDRAVDLASITDDMLAEPFLYEIPRPNIERVGDKLIYTQPDGTQREVTGKEANEIWWNYERENDELDDNLTVDQKYNMIVFNDGWAVALKPYRYHKEHGTQEPNGKPSRKYSKFRTGIGDTGDHDRRPSPFVTNGGKVQGQEYNAYFMSGDAQAIRRTRQNMYDVYVSVRKQEKLADKYKNDAEEAKAEGKYWKYRDYKDLEAGAREEAEKLRKELESMRPRAREHIAQYRPHSIMPAPLYESDIRTIVEETINRLLEGITR